MKCIQNEFGAHFENNRFTRPVAVNGIIDLFYTEGNIKILHKSIFTVWQMKNVKEEVLFLKTLEYFF